MPDTLWLRPLVPSHVVIAVDLTEQSALLPYGGIHVAAGIVISAKPPMQVGGAMGVALMRPGAEYAVLEMPVVRF